MPANKKIFESIFPRFNKPDLLNVPELILSSLAWYEITDQEMREKKKDPEGKPLGLAFRVVKKANPRSNFAVDQTKPIEHTDEDIRWKEALEENTGFEVTRDGARAILASMEGIRTTGAKSVCALPFSFKSALLQDRVGIIRAENPYNIEGIVNQVYFYGDMSAKDKTASRLWSEMAIKVENSLLEGIDRSIVEGLGPLKEYGLNQGEMNFVGKRLERHYPQWLEPYKEDTPFNWFYRNWNCICSDAWKQALSPRKYLDWTIFVARTGISLSLLWNDRFLSGVLACVMKQEDSSDEWVTEINRAVGKGKENPLLLWGPRSMKSANDTRPRIVYYIRAGLEAEEKIKIICKRMEEEGVEILPGKEGLVNWIEQAREIVQNDEDFFNRLKRNEVDSRRVDRRGFFFNYLLETRDTLGVNVDHYGLVQRSGKKGKGRFYPVDPGSEWLAALTSLSLEEPGKTGTLGTVVRSLNQLGLYPETSLLTQKLHACGLCNPKEDADLGLEVTSGF